MNKRNSLKPRDGSPRREGANIDFNVDSDFKKQTTKEGPGKLNMFSEEMATPKSHNSNFMTKKSDKQVV